MRDLTPPQISQLMSISDKLGDLNYARFHSWQQPFNTDNAKQAVLAFKGDVYTGLQADQMSDQELQWAQQHLRILSGLYGVLKPLDLMQPYRLEMGTRFENSRGKNLYEFWGDKITTALNDELQAQGSATVINLASNEYFKAVKPKALNADIITPVFKDWKNDKYKIISFYAKKARGMMARYVIDNRLTDVDALKDFNVEDYKFDAASSSDTDWVFSRLQPPPVGKK